MGRRLTLQIRVPIFWVFEFMRLPHMPIVQHSLPTLPRIPLSPHQWSTLLAHTFKATFRQHHGALSALFRSLVPDDGVVIDVGAHAGQFAKLFARLVPEGRVYAFEPGRYARLILSLSLALNRVRNVYVFPVGLGREQEALPLNMPIKSSGSFGFGLSHLSTVGADKRAHMVTESIDVITLDAFSATMPIRRIDLIKADIEGWELQMLQGAADVLTRFRPALYLEVYDEFLLRAGDSAVALASYLSGLGYIAYSVTHDGQAVPTDQVAGGGDLLWLPVERRMDGSVIKQGSA